MRIRYDPILGAFISFAPDEIKEAISVLQFVQSCATTDEAREEIASIIRYINTLERGGNDKNN